MLTLVLFLFLFMFHFDVSSYRYRLGDVPRRDVRETDTELPGAECEPHDKTPDRIVLFCLIICLY